MKNPISIPPPPPEEHSPGTRVHHLRTHKTYTILTIDDKTVEMLTITDVKVSIPREEFDTVEVYGGQAVRLYGKISRPERPKGASFG